MSLRPADDAAGPAPQALEAYFEYALNGIVEATADGRIVRANPAAASILGRSPRRLRDASLDAVLAHDDEDARARLARHGRTLAEQGVSLATMSVTIDGASRTIELASIDLGDGRHLHILDDITEQQQLTDRLQAARRAADEANAAKSAFLANMSHEIRTPLNGIIGLERLLRLTPLTAQQAEYLNDLRRAAQTLLALLGGVLDLARIESGRFELEARDFDADEFLETVATACGPAAAGKPIRVLFDVEPGIPRQWHGDPLRLAQAVNNLLGNAIKFTHAGQVTLAVSWSADGGGRLRLAVSDSGPGMTAEQLQRVFSPFVQADPSVTRRYGGSGLGLAIARGTVEAMGGTISASSRPGAGSEFVIEVPMAAAGAGAAARAGAAPRALVISGDARQRQALLRLLAAEQITAEPRDADDPMAILASPPDTLLLVDDACEPLLARLQREGRAGSLILVRARVDAVANGEAAVVLRAPATPRRLREAIAQRLQSGPQSIAEVNPAEWLRDEYAGAAVLLVEDDAISRRVTMELLSFAGIDVTVAENGRAAVDILTAPGARPVQLVFMDVQMPEMDGLTATRTLRAAGIDTPIVALTAGASVEEREACFGAGMNDWLGKPPELADLEAVLARWLPARGGPAPAPAPAAATAAGAAPKETLAGIDEEAALQRFLGNRAAFAETLQAFVAAQRPAIGQIGSLLAAGERDTAARHLHTLAGSAAVLGAEHLQATARALEDTVRRGGQPQREDIGRLAAAFEEVARAAGQIGPG
jgi:two-component system sensor histidine kinase/response regulator